MIEIKQKPQQTIIRKDNVRPFKTPAQKRQIRVLIGVVVVIIVVAVAAYFIIIPAQKTYLLKDYETVIIRRADLIQTTQASGAVAIPVQLNVLSPESGYVERLYTAEGETVEKDQLLVTLNAKDLLDELDDSTSSLEDNRRNLTKVETQNQFTIQKMERDLVSLDKQIKEARDEVAKLNELVKINASRKSELDTKEKTLDDLLDKKNEAEISLKEEKQLQKLDIDIRKATILQTETKISRLHDRIIALTVRAPMSGDILEMEKSLAVPGSLVTINQLLFTIADPASAIVELEVLEDYAGALAVNQEIVLTISGQEVKGRIISIGKVATVSSDGLGATVQVKVKPESERANLLLGSTAVGTLVLGKKAQTLLLPRGPYLTTGSQKYLYKVSGDTAERMEVTFGTIQGNDVEILSGVKEGDTVIVSGYQNFIEYKTIRLRKGV